MVTIKDVAALAGVSTSTASRAMHNNKVISDETKQLVFNAMKELGYEPNYAARNLANKTSNTIGVILPVAGPEIFQNPFYVTAFFIRFYLLTFYLLRILIRVIL